MDYTYENLIRRISSIGFNMDSDFPSNVQVEGNREGVLVFTEYEEDDDGYFTGNSREYTGTFADAIQEAIDCVAWDLSFGGLSRDEALTLLLAPEYRTKTFELIDLCDSWGGLSINGTRFTIEDGQLVNEDFGVWPFENETE